MKYHIERTDGKDITGNTYLVVNADEPYAGRVADIVEACERAKGTWDHGDHSLREVMDIAEADSNEHVETYKSWDFCKATGCNFLIRDEAIRADLCKSCPAYQMHQYLHEHGQVLEEGSKLQTDMSNHRATVEATKNILDDLNHMRSQLAEAQADNAALVETIKTVINIHIAPGCTCDDAGYICPRCRVFTTCHLTLNNPHPGADLLIELEQYKRAYETVTGIMGKLINWCPPTPLEECHSEMGCGLCLRNYYLSQAKAGGQ